MPELTQSLSAHYSRVHLLTKNTCPTNDEVMSNKITNEDNSRSTLGTPVDNSIVGCMVRGGGGSSSTPSVESKNNSVEELF